jgi:hypothetical protein
MLRRLRNVFTRRRRQEPELITTPIQQMEIIEEAALPQPAEEEPELVVAPEQVQILEEPEPQLQRPCNVGRAFEIHNEFAGINIIKLKNILDNKLSNIPKDTYIKKTDSQFLDWVKIKLAKFINDNKDKFQVGGRPTGSYVEQNMYIKHLQTIISSLKDYSMDKRLIGRTIDFVFTQPKEFIVDYIKGFITDNACAYSENKIDIRTAKRSDFSCVKGMYERFVTTLKDLFLARC